VKILNEEFLKPLGLTANALAKAIGCHGDGALCRSERSAARRLDGGAG
jgi:plasmid maintenance system antidote protein VapI